MKKFFILLALIVGSESIGNKLFAAEPVYIDVRSWAEHQVDSIEGHSRIHVSEIVEGVQTQFPDTSTSIRLYCAKGGRAQKATDKLIAAGYTDVINLGGIDDVRALQSSKLEGAGLEGTKPEGTKETEQ